jgi:hypothetical protein
MTMAKQKPTGFIATCQCGMVVGAMDYSRTERRDAGKLLGQWLADGCTVEPRFQGTWSADVMPCRCDDSSNQR